MTLGDSYRIFLQRDITGGNTKLGGSFIQTILFEVEKKTRGEFTELIYVESCKDIIEVDH